MNRGALQTVDADGQHGQKIAIKVIAIGISAGRYSLFAPHRALVSGSVRKSRERMIVSAWS